MCYLADQESSSIVCVGTGFICDCTAKWGECTGICQERVHTPAEQFLDVRINGCQYLPRPLVKAVDATIYTGTLLVRLGSILPDATQPHGKVTLKGRTVRVSACVTDKQ